MAQNFIQADVAKTPTGKLTGVNVDVNGVLIVLGAPSGAFVSLAGAAQSPALVSPGDPVFGNIWPFG